MNVIAFRTTAALPVYRDARNQNLFVNSTTLRFDIIRDEARFLELAPVWDTLLDQSASQSRFLRWDWVSLWWAEYRESFELAVGVVRNVWPQPVAIAPLVIGRGEIGAESPSGVSSLWAALTISNRRVSTSSFRMGRRHCLHRCFAVFSVFCAHAGT